MNRTMHEYNPDDAKEAYRAYESARAALANAHAFLLSPEMFAVDVNAARISAEAAVQALKQLHDYLSEPDVFITTGEAA